jgi:hypothetical protein
MEQFSVLHDEEPPRIFLLFSYQVDSAAFSCLSVGSCGELGIELARCQTPPWVVR